MDLQDTMISAMEELNETLLQETVKQLVEQDISKADLVRLLQQGIFKVGTRFEKGDYFIADLMMSALMFRDMMDYIESMDKTRYYNTGKGRILIGVMHGDVHDIGKDLVAQTLRANGFEVDDLGVDVKAETFIRHMYVNPPDILMLTGVMDFATAEMERVLLLLKEQKLLSTVKVVVGGCCLTRMAAEKLDGIYAYAADPIETTAICEKIMEQTQKNE